MIGLSGLSRTQRDGFAPESGHTKSSDFTAKWVLYLCLLGDFQGIVHFYSKVTNRTLKLGVAKQ